MKRNTNQMEIEGVNKNLKMIPGGRERGAVSVQKFDVPVKAEKIITRNPPATVKKDMIDLTREIQNKLGGQNSVSRNDEKKVTIENLKGAFPLGNIGQNKSISSDKEKKTMELEGLTSLDQLITDIDLLFYDK